MVLLPWSPQFHYEYHDPDGQVHPVQSIACLTGAFAIPVLVVGLLRRASSKGRGLTLGSLLLSSHGHQNCPTQYLNIHHLMYLQSSPSAYKT